MRRRVLWAIVLLCVGVGAVLGYEVYRALTAVPGDAVDYSVLLDERLGAYEAGLPVGIEGLAAPEPGITAWDAMVSANEALRDLEAEVAARFCPVERCFPMYEYLGAGGEARVRRDHPRSTDDYVEMHRIGAAVVEEVAGTEVDRLMDHIARCGRPGVSFPGEPGGGLPWLGDLGRVRSLSRLNAARMRLHAAGDEHARFARVAEQTLGLCRMVSGLGVTGRLTAQACITRVFDEIRDYVLWRQPPPDACRRLIRVLERQREHAPMALVWEIDQILMRAEWQSYHASDGRFLVHEWRAAGMALDEPLESILPDHKISNIAHVLYPTFEEQMRDSDVTMEAIVAATDLPPSAWGGDADVNVDDLPGFGMTGVSFSMERILLQIRAAEALWRTHWNASVLLLAIRAHEGETGTPPSSLEALVPGVLDALPEDPFAPDGRFRYRVLDEPDEIGLGFELYSVGSDMKDDGGQHGDRVNSAFDLGASLFGFADAYEGLDAVYTRMQNRD